MRWASLRSRCSATKENSVFDKNREAQFKAYNEAKKVLCANPQILIGLEKFFSQHFLRLVQGNWRNLGTDGTYPNCPVHTIGGRFASLTGWCIPTAKWTLPRPQNVSPQKNPLGRE
jgi:hypothetical protein